MLLKAVAFLNNHGLGVFYYASGDFYLPNFAEITMG